MLKDTVRPFEGILKIKDAKATKKWRDDALKQCPLNWDKMALKLKTFFQSWENRMKVFTLQLQSNGENLVKRLKKYKENNKAKWVQDTIGTWSLNWWEKDIKGVTKAMYKLMEPRPKAKFTYWNCNSLSPNAIDKVKQWLNYLDIRQKDSLTRMFEQDKKVFDAYNTAYQDEEEEEQESDVDESIFGKYQEAKLGYMNKYYGRKSADDESVNIDEMIHKQEMYEIMRYLLTHKRI